MSHVTEASRRTLQLAAASFCSTLGAGAMMNDYLTKQKLLIGCDLEKHKLLYAALALIYLSLEF